MIAIVILLVGGVTNRLAPPAGPSQGRRRGAGPLRGRETGTADFLCKKDARCKRQQNDQPKQNKAQNKKPPKNTNANRTPNPDQIDRKITEQEPPPKKKICQMSGLKRQKNQRTPRGTLRKDPVGEEDDEERIAPRERGDGTLGTIKSPGPWHRKSFYCPRT